eukprot:TRINITY_DN89695_c0_g1_i1.p1 TRINITY_DN89695_c0_g1~~TRINITY_DN89695_c0_g1_i1.p1  ORF type:complete len:223 (+),score=31.08 TRINITY_DN89695_c0_g1_i1:34-669(+)
MARAMHPGVPAGPSAPRAPPFAGDECRENDLESASSDCEDSSDDDLDLQHARYREQSECEVMGFECAFPVFGILLLFVMVVCELHVSLRYAHLVPPTAAPMNSVCWKIYKVIVCAVISHVITLFASLAQLVTTRHRLDKCKQKVAEHIFVCSIVPGVCMWVWGIVTLFFSGADAHDTGGCRELWWIALASYIAAMGLLLMQFAAFIKRRCM